MRGRPHLGLVARFKRRLEDRPPPICPACLRKIDADDERETVHGRPHHRKCARFVR